MLSFADIFHHLFGSYQPVDGMMIICKNFYQRCCPTTTANNTKRANHKIVLGNKITKRHHQIIPIFVKVKFSKTINCQKKTYFSNNLSLATTFTLSPSFKVLLMALNGPVTTSSPSFSPVWISIKLMSCI